MWRRLHGVAVTTVGLATPGMAALAGLFVLGHLALGPTLIAIAVVLIVTVLVVAPFANAIGALRDGFAALEAEAMAPLAAPTRLTPRLEPRGTLGLSATRLARIWRERVAAAEARLAAAEAVIAAVPDPLILLDSRRQIVRANLHSIEFVGVVAEPRDLAQSVRNPAVLAAADAVLGGETARVVEFAVTVPVERRLRARLARIDGPPLDGAVAILTLYDITALKRAEQMRADFIANASHELKTPLATLSGFIETLRGPARADAKARERFLAIMNDEAARMTRLVEDLLSLSRIELNEHVAPTEHVALAPVLQEVANALQLRAAERGMTIVLRIPPDLPAVFADRDELAQVFQNLLDNAIKYGRAATAVTIDAGLATRVGVDGGRGRDPTPLAWVAVTDHGDGIPSEHLTRLTERFYRVDAARSRQMGGTGLGLAIVKHILNRHRGMIEIDSILGVGSTFTIFVRPTPGAVIEP